MSSQVNFRSVKDKYNDWLIITCDNSPSEHARMMSKNLVGLCSSIYKSVDKSHYINKSEYLDLRDWLNEQRNSSDLLKTVLQASKLCVDCIKHLIKSENIVFDLSYSFYSASEESIKLVFLPVIGEAKVGSFSKWSSEVISLAQNWESKCSCEDETIELEKIRVYLHSEKYCLVGLIQRLENAIKTIGSKAYSPKNELGDLKDSLIKEDFNSGLVIDSETPSPSFSSNAMFESFKPKAAPQFSHSNKAKHFSVPNSTPPENKSYKYGYSLEDFNAANVKVEKEPMNNLAKEHSYLSKRKIFIGVQVIIALVFIASAVLAYFKFSDSLKGLAGVTIIFTIIEYLVIKYVYRAKQEQLDDESAEDCKPSLEDFSKQRSGLQDQSLSSDKTAMLYMANIAVPKLIRNSDGLEYELQKSETSIGRQKGEVDLIIPDISASRRHATIKRRNGMVYLMDSGSLNGSFVNGIRVNPNEYTEISIGDTISFSRVNYTLRAE